MNDDRFEDGLSIEARALIAIGRDGDEPSAADRARVRTKLLGAVAGVAGVGGAGTAAAAKASAAAGKVGVGTALGHAGGAVGLTGAKLGAGLLIAALTAAGAGYMGMRAASPDQPAAAPAQHEPKTIGVDPLSAQASAPTAVAATPIIASRMATHAAPSSAPAPAARELEARPEPVAQAYVEPSAPAASEAAGSDSAVAVETTPEREHDTRAGDRPREAARVRAAARGTGGLHVLATRVRHRAAAPSADEQSDPAPASSLRRELSLIAAAQSALANDAPDEALRWLDAHAAGYPHGALVQERLAARAVALCALGRTAEGRKDAAELSRVAGDSPLLGRARRACTMSSP